MKKKRKVQAQEKTNGLSKRMVTVGEKENVVEKVLKFKNKMHTQKNKHFVFVASRRKQSVCFFSLELLSERKKKVLM